MSKFANLVAACEIVVASLEKLDDRTGAVKTEDLATECGMSKEDTKRLIDAHIARS